MVDIYAEEREKINLKNRTLINAERASIEAKETSSFSDNFKAQSALIFNESTFAGQNINLIDIYRPTYEQFRELTGERIAYDEGEDRISTGSHILRFLRDHQEDLTELRAKGVEISTYQELKDKEQLYYNELNTAAEKAFDGSFSAYAGWLTGAAWGNVQDPFNAATLLAGAAPKLGVGILSNVLRGFGREAAIETGLQVKDKPGEVRIREELLGEEVSEGQVLAESALTVGVVGVAGGAIVGAGRALARSPQQVVRDIAKDTPSGMRPEEHVQKTLQTHLELESAQVNRSLDPESSIDDAVIQDDNITRIHKAVKQEDVVVPSRTGEEGEILEGFSLRQELDNYEQDKDILTKIGDCLGR